MIIDIFNHFMPKPYFDRLGDLIPGHPVLAAFPRLRPLLDVDARLRLLDEFGDMQHVLSLANPPLELIAGPDKTPELARLANDALAEVCRKHPDRFPAFIASLPMNNIEASLTEIDRAVKDLHACGIQLFTNVTGRPLSAPEYRPIFARMVAHDLPVWVHPMRTAQFSDYASEQASENEIWFSFGWPYETTACMTRLIYSGIFDEMPALKIVSHHMGGMIPYFSGKIKLPADFLRRAGEKSSGRRCRAEKATGRLFQDALCRHRARRGRADPLRPRFFRHVALFVCQRCAVRFRTGPGPAAQFDRGGGGAGDFADGEGCDLCREYEEAVEVVTAVSRTRCSA